MQEPTARDRLLKIYDQMLERVHEWIVETEEKALPNLNEALHHAQERAVHLGEATREEAHEVAEFLRRDLDELRAYVRETGRDLGSWLRLDVNLIETRLLDMIGSIADPTRLALTELEDENRERAEWRTGEIAGIGTLVCNACGHRLRFVVTAHIPKCPECGGTSFSRMEADAATPADETH